MVSLRAMPDTAPTERKPLVIYHGNCPDGFTAAWVAARALGYVELYAGKYGEPPPLAAAAGRDVYVVDFSYPREQLVELKDASRSLLVLDHHKTAQAALEGLDYCVFDMERSGAGLAWDHFFAHKPRPWIVDYVEDRDLWRFRMDHSETISLMVRLTPHELPAYDALAELPLPEVLDLARGAKRHLDHYVRDAVRNAYDLRKLFDDETVRCVNVSYTGVSDVLHAALSAGGVRVALGWHVNKSGELYCSLRSNDDVDCSVFAQQHGGGGHAQASGFRTSVNSPIAHRLFRQS